MASSDNLVTIEPQPWRFGQAMADCWISDFFTKETETLTRALTKSFTNSSPTDHTSTDMVESLLVKPETTPSQTPTASGCSENEVPFSKRRNVAASGRITKRKSRASKRATTTFITADPANFRQMVQQVTGLRFGGDLNGLIPVAPMLKPDPQRSIHMFQTGCALPTLDTSSFLLDQQVVQPPVVSVPPPSTVVADGGAAGFSFDSFCSFPTLESWKVM
ncbi:Calmodulin-binding protein 25 [Forsythia ovata]|uniref:Calmodulin-binding protein 25 n=1 Tax=Forsythia ovata TaxID=205694 RepID=A0ABD1R3I0_9LAMI